MKLFEVEWKVLTNQWGGLQSGVSPYIKRGFSTRLKAEDFYKELMAAAQKLGISGSIEIHIHEVEIE